MTAHCGIADVDAIEDQLGQAGVPVQAVQPAAHAKCGQPARALIVDDDRTLREGCASVLRGEGFTVDSTGRGDEAIDMIAKSHYAIMLVDVFMTPVSGVEILKAVRATSPDTLVVLMTGNPSVASSIEAMRIGAWDYISKPYSGTQLQLLVGRAMHIVSSHRDLPVPEPEVLMQGTDKGHLLMGAAPAIREALELAKKAAATNASVMIVGETGTGKEVFARFIHQNSRRARKLLVPINCAAIPDHLLESEMFGHRKGAFTGASREKMGLLEMADGGTLFLDELTEMPMSLQTKLLRVLQDGIVRRVGSEHSDTVVDVRFVSATNQDPRDAIQKKQLREDLYYRLNVIQVTLPPLRQRTEDIGPLANHFLAHFWSRHRLPTEKLPRFSENAMDALRSRPWRGNVRELQNFIEHVSIVAAPAGDIQIRHLPLDHEVDPGSADGSPMSAPTSDVYHVARDQALAAFEKTFVKRLITRASGNMSRAARLACVDRTTLYRLLERQGFRRDMTDTHSHLAWEDSPPT